MKFNLKYLTAEGTLYVYNEEDEFSLLIFENNNWDFAPLNLFCLQHDSIITNISEEEALKITGGKKPNNLMRELYATLELASGEDNEKENKIR